jgi:hypothetical protein
MGEFPVIENDQGSYPFDAQIRSFGGGPGGAPQGGGLFGGGPGGPPQGGGLFGGEPMYPGLGGNPYGELIQPGGGSNLPAVGGGSGGSGGAGGLGNLLGSFNFNQIRTFIERMGGIDGIVGTMGKVQKMVAGFQQMAPMLKLVLGAFGSKKSAARNAGLVRAPRARRRRKKRGGRARYGSGKRPGGGRTRR